MTKLPQMDTPEPPAPVAPSTPPAKPGKLRTYISVGVLVVILGVVLYAVRNNQSADDLAVGTCFDVPTTTEVSTVEKHPCTEAHDAEVIFTGEYTGGDTYPLAISLTDYLSTTCAQAFESYVGESYDTNTTLDMSYFKPSVDSWNQGDRTFTCYVQDANEAKLSNSVKTGAAPAGS
jgi:hypothetical protein